MLVLSSMASIAALAFGSAPSKRVLVIYSFPLGLSRHDLPKENKQVVRDLRDRCGVLAESRRCGARRRAPEDGGDVDAPRVRPRSVAAQLGIFPTVREETGTQLRRNGDAASFAEETGTQLVLGRRNVG